MPSVLAAALCASSFLQAQASDYFPLAAGARWVYAEQGTHISARYAFETGVAVELAGERAIPIFMIHEGKPIEPVYYRASSDTIWIVAYDAKKPLEAARPLFRIGEKKEKWDYSGTTPFMGETVPIAVVGESSPKGKRKVLDKEVECIEIRLEAKIGRSELDRMTTKQTALYGKGIGLVEMSETSVVGKNKNERKMKLIEFVPAP